MCACKWLPSETEDQIDLFKLSKEIELVCVAMSRKLLALSHKWRSFGVENPPDYVTLILHVQDLEKLNKQLKIVVKSSYKLTPMLYRIKDSYEILYCKRNISIENVCKSRYLLIEALDNLISNILGMCLASQDPRKIIEGALRLIERYNELLGVSSKAFLQKFNVCSNACPQTLDHNRTINIARVIQILALSRAEENCHRLINCLVQNHGEARLNERRSHHDEQSLLSNLNNDIDDTSSSSSFEIYQTLTKYMSPQKVRPVTSKTPSELRKVAFAESRRERMRNCLSLADLDKKHTAKMKSLNSDSEVPYTSLVDSLHSDVEQQGTDNKVALNKLLRGEDLYIEILLDATWNVAPQLFPNHSKHKEGDNRVKRKSALKIAEKYLLCVWNEVASILEHVVLWWGNTKLASRSPDTIQSLREWLSTFNSINTPPLILSALRSLADGIGCHVTLTLWDKLFGATLVSDVNLTNIKMQPDISLIVSDCTMTGSSFALLFDELVRLSNQCEVSGELIMGASVDQLPIVEQIPILHRLDHSVHQCRLWCLQESRTLANRWQMDAFFRILQNDIPAALEQLLGLRFADHSLALEKGIGVGVHEMVCAKMREKLVSEIKENIKKLKDSSDVIGSLLASVAHTVCLAHLQMIFPKNIEWKLLNKTPDPCHSEYVPLYLERVLLPVIKATKDIVFMNIMLKILCESWLHHIYVSQVKFSKDAAVQLLYDFDEVRHWLQKCKYLNCEMKKQMLRNEVLRRCEGVGRLLLHSPGDPISMQEPHAMHKQKDAEMDSEMMPSEMYVPNQQQWLTLRTRGPNCQAFCYYCLFN